MGVHGFMRNFAIKITIKLQLIHNIIQFTHRKYLQEEPMVIMETLVS